MGECRDKGTEDTSIACTSEEEEVSDESAVLITEFSDGMRYCRFSITRGAAEPTYRSVVVVVSPSHKFCDDSLSSAWVAVGSGCSRVICSTLDGREYFVDS